MDTFIDIESFIVKKQIKQQESLKTIMTDNSTTIAPTSSRIENEDFSTIEILPEEVLMKIFTLSSANDLHALKLTCKNFNNVINSSTKLLDKFFINISDESNPEKLNWIKSQKCPKIRILSWEQCYNLEAIGSHVTTLHLSLATLEMKTFKDVLLFFPKLKHLSAVINTIKKAWQIEGLLKEPMPRLKLETLWLNSNNKTNSLKLFSNGSVMNFTIKNFSCFEIRDLKEFLKYQTDLKSLEFAWGDWLEIFNDDFLNIVNFRLEKLKIRCRVKNVEENFAKFLLNHKNSLQELFIPNIDDKLALVLNNFTNLKSLSVADTISPNFTKTDKISELVVSKVEPIHIKMFPFTEILGFLSSSGEISYVENFQHLKYLKVQIAKNIPEINIPNVKFLSFFDVHCQGKPFRYENSNLVGIKLEHMKTSPEWLTEYLEREETSLRSLKITHSRISPSVRAAIERNRSKIIFLDIVDCS